MNIPELVYSNREREYDLYSEQQRGAVVYEYLFNEKPHRKLDEEVLAYQKAFSQWEFFTVWD